MQNLITRQRLSRLLFLAFVASTMLFTLSCKKETTVEVSPTTEPESEIKLDSVYFEIEGKPYSAEPDIRGMNGIRNGGYRMKYLDGPKEGMTIYHGSGSPGQGWYAATDSIYFSCYNTYRNQEL